MCSRMDEVRHFEMMLFNLSYYSDLKTIIMATGCISPCVYNEYKLSSEPEKISKKFFNANWVQVEFASDVRIEKEIEFYSFVSFVSDIGGALGLFSWIFFCDDLGWRGSNFQED